MWLNTLYHPDVRSYTWQDGTSERADRPYLHLYGGWGGAVVNVNQTLSPILLSFLIVVVLVYSEERGPLEILH